jgi:DNA-binding MarR family transcriptional regulator
MDFPVLLALLRTNEAQPGDARIVEAQLICLLLEKPLQTAEEIGQALGLSISSVSRTTRRLMQTTRNGTPGQDLLVCGRDPREGRRLVYSLNKRAIAALS